MIDAVLIGLWAYLFCGPLSEAGQIFGGLKSAAYARLPWWLFNPLIGCAKCHAGQVALWLQVLSAYNGNGFDFSVVICGIFAAILFEDFEAIREKWKNS